jgi:signal transduction histidine kinase
MRRAHDVPVGRDRWAWVLALAFVTLTLAALVAIPVLVQRRVTNQRARMEAAQPARTLLMGLQYNLVREMSTLNQYAVTGEAEFAQAFGAARAAERQIWSEFAPLAAALGTAVHERFVEARTHAQLWHEQLNEDELLRRGRASVSVLQATDVTRRFEEVLRATGRLDAAILQQTARTRERIARAENVGMLLTFVSGGLALLAAAVVAALAIRIRRLAAEAEHRRRVAAEALEQTARAAEARERLLRGITHDVKNPLGAARGYAELLSMGVKGAMNPEQEQLVRGVERSIDSALAIISDLLDLARADGGGITVQRVQTDLNDVAQQAVDDHRAVAERAGHEITLQAAPGSLMSYTDPMRVREVLDNLITNAIKYTPPPGRIVVRTEANASDAPDGRRSVAIRVTDTGPGIPDDKRETIFDEFTRLEDNSGKRGHGLGLAIARRIARLLGGELGLSHCDGPGATFALWLPQREQRDQPEQREPLVQPAQGVIQSR